MSRCQPLVLIALAVACSSPTSGGGAQPTVSLTANPTGVTTGTSSTLSWTSTNATGCSASGGWSGSLPASGNQQVSPTATTLYRITCSGQGGSASDSVIVTFSSSPAPTVTLIAAPDTIQRGQSTTLTWSSSNDTLCTASGGWSGTQAASGSHGFSPTSTTTYTLSCAGAGGTTRASVQVVVIIPAPPTVNLTASPTSIAAAGDTSTLTWSSSNDTLCTASGGWSGTQALSGTKKVTPMVTTVYTLTCAGPGGNTPKSATVTVGGTSSGYVYPLKVNGRYLVDQNGKPFLYMGDAAWSLIAQLGDSDAETYFANRASHGFTVAMINVIEHKFATNAPNNIYGDAPFTDTLFTNPNPNYFAHMDAVVQSALNHNMVVQLDALYLGASCGSEGWASEVNSAGAAALQRWGAYLGARYKNYPNIIWQVGGDVNPQECGNAPTYLSAMVTGIQSADPNHPFITHNNAEDTDQNDWQPYPSWINIHSVYTYSTTLYTNVASEVVSSPTLPTVLIETAYENESTYGGGSSPTGAELRAQIYWTLFEGGIGNVFGDCPIWNFDTPSHGAYCPETGWKTFLDDTGSVNMQHAAALFNSRHWSKLVPDASHTVLTAGYGSGTSYVTTAYASDSSSIMAYLPASTTVTVTGAKLSGSTMNVWWYNPGTGVATQVTAGGPFATTGSYQFTPPSAGDWVLVLDSGNFGFGPPGS